MHNFNMLSAPFKILNFRLPTRLVLASLSLLLPLSVALAEQRPIPYQQKIGEASKAAPIGINLLRLSIDKASVEAMMAHSSVSQDGVTEPAIDQATFIFEHPNLSQASFNELSNPTRIVIDVPEIEGASEISAPFFDNPVFSQLHTKEHNNHLRLVLDMRRQYTPYYEWCIKGNKLSILVKQKKGVSISESPKLNGIPFSSASQTNNSEVVTPTTPLKLAPESEGVIRPLSPAVQLKKAYLEPSLITFHPDAPETPVEISKAGEQQLQKIEFRQTPEGKAELYLKLTEQAQFKLTRKAPGEYTLIIPATNLLSDALKLPYFAPQNASGWLAVQANKIASDVSVRMVTTPESKIRAYALENGIGVTSEENAIQ